MRGVRLRLLDSSVLPRHIYPSLLPPASQNSTFPTACEPTTAPYTRLWPKDDAALTLFSFSGPVSTSTALQKLLRPNASHLHNDPDIVAKASRTRTGTAREMQCFEESDISFSEPPQSGKDWNLKRLSGVTY